MAILAGSLAVTYLATDRQALKTQSVPAIKAKLAQYDMDTTYDSIDGLGPMRPMGHFPRVSFFNIAVLFTIGSVFWSVASYRTRRQEPRSAPDSDVVV